MAALFGWCRCSRGHKLALNGHHKPKTRVPNFTNEAAKEALLLNITDFMSFKLKVRFEKKTLHFRMGIRVYSLQYVDICCHVVPAK